ncbi:acetyltransferase [bacterium]|nr:acetyltransferase [bacterium]
MYKIGLVGCSGFGREVMPLLKLNAHSRFKNCEISFVDTSVAKKNIGLDKVLDESAFLEDEVAEKKLFNIAIADPKIRFKVSEKYIETGCYPIEIRARNAHVLDRVEIAEGSIICAFSHLTSDIKIGKFFHCNIYSYVAHDCVIGDFVTFAPKVCCNGNVHIHNNAYIGTGAVIKQGTPEKPLVIGEGAVVGMGAVVTKDVAPYQVVVGNPAKPLSR